MRVRKPTLAGFLCLFQFACAVAPSELSEETVASQTAAANAKDKAADHAIHPGNRHGQDHAPAAGLARAETPPKQKIQQAGDKLQQAGNQDQQIPWSKLGLRRLEPNQTKLEFVPQGPSALSVLPNGQVLLLDRLNRRVLQLRLGGKLRAIATVPSDAEDLASNAAGNLLVFSPVRSRAWFFSAGGQAAGQLPVPRSLRHLTHVELGPLNRIYARSGFQELFDLGLALRPRNTRDILASKLETAVRVSAKQGAVVVASGGRAILRIQPLGRAARQTASATVEHQLHGVDAARILGHHAGILCLRTETRRDVASQIEVHREVRCLHASDGSTAFRSQLPEPGLYLPKRELVFRHGWLAFMHPQAAGLRIQTWQVSP